MFWDQPPQKHCATAVYLKHLWGSTLESYVRYNVWTSDFFCILRLLFAASMGSSSSYQESTDFLVSKVCRHKNRSFQRQRHQNSESKRANATAPHLAQRAVPPWHREDVSFQLMACGAAKAPKVLELKMWHKKIPNNSRVWNRFLEIYA